MGGEVKLDRDDLNKQKRKDTEQMKKIWFGNIPDIFGYGISCLGNSKKEVMDTMKKEYKQWKAGRAKHGFGDESTNFETSYEYYGGWVEQVEIGKGYYEGLRE